MKTQYSPHKPLIDEARHQYSPVSPSEAVHERPSCYSKQLLIKSRKEKKEWKTCGNCLAKNLRKKRICITCGAKQITEDVESMSRPSASTSTEQFSHVIEVQFESGHSSVTTHATVSSSNVTPIEISVLDPIFVNPNSHQSLITVSIKDIGHHDGISKYINHEGRQEGTCHVESGRCNLWWVAIHHPAKSDKGDFPMRNLWRHSISREGCSQHLTGKTSNIQSYIYSVTHTLTSKLNSTGCC